MIRFIVRLVALFALAGGFAALLIDGTRSIAANHFVMTPLGATCATFLPRQFAALQAAAGQLRLIPWDVILRDVFALPTWLVLTVVGIILFWLAQPPRPKIGYSSRP